MAMHKRSTSISGIVTNPGWSRIKGEEANTAATPKADLDEEDEELKKEK